VLPVGESLAQRATYYQGHIEDVVNDPISKHAFKNVYFGLVMGASALIPTLAHAGMASHALFRTGKSRLFRRGAVRDAA
jgi:hypothetical protein